MRTAARLLAGLAAILIVNSTPAKAETQFPWCAHYFDGTGASNCGFDSEEQCKMTVGGNSGTCDRNLAYRGPAAAPLSTPAAAPVAVPAPPGRKIAALTSQAKMKTCQFGADDQKLTGAARKKFMARCMSNKDDPRGPGPAPR